MGQDIESSGNKALTLEKFKEGLIPLSANLKWKSNILERDPEPYDPARRKENVQIEIDQKKLELQLLQLVKKSFEDLPDERNEVIALIKRELGEARYSTMITELYFAKLDAVAEAGTESEDVQEVVDGCEQATSAIKG